jgi:hypothetical protein
MQEYRYYHSPTPLKILVWTWKESLSWIILKATKVQLDQEHGQYSPYYSERGLEVGN